MGPLNALWHLLNFFAPAVAVALIAAFLAKLVWRRELAARSWQQLTLWGSAAGASALVGGLLVFGHDGKMATYALLVAATALALWWVGFLRR
jgi:glucose-6-phosphate-specific signal transduction histidine kinase